MRFAIMTWAGDDAMDESIFGVVDERDGDAKLPALSPNGFWADFCLVDERQFKLAAEAKTAIEQYGYYLIGAGVAMTDIFETPDKSAA